MESCILVIDSFCHFKKGKWHLDVSTEWPVGVFSGGVCLLVDHLGSAVAQANLKVRPSSEEFAFQTFFLTHWVAYSSCRYQQIDDFVMPFVESYFNCCLILCDEFSLLSEMEGKVTYHLQAIDLMRPIHLALLFYQHTNNPNG